MVDSDFTQLLDQSVTGVVSDAGIASKPKLTEEYQDWPEYGWGGVL